AALLTRADAARARDLTGAAARALADEGVGAGLLGRAGLQPAQRLHLGLDAGLGLLLQRLAGQVGQLLGLFGLDHPARRGLGVALEPFRPRLGAARGIGVGRARLDVQADRRALQVEALADRVDQIALVVVRHRLGPAGHHHERRRTGLGLGDVFGLDALAVHGGRRVPLRR